MIDIDKWQEILLTLEQHKLRTALTAFGVFWGIFMLVMLLGAGKGLENGVKGQFGGQKNSVFLWTGGKTQIPHGGLKSGRTIWLKSEDLDVMRATLPELGLLSGVNFLGGGGGSQTISRNGRSGPFSGMGLEPDALIINGFQMASGRFINALDYVQKRKVAVIGASVKDVLFEPGEDPLGKTIDIGGIPFVVIGVTVATGTGGDSRRQAERVILPNSTLRYTFNQLAWIGYLQMTPAEGVHALKLENAVLRLLRERHRVHPDDSGVFGSFNAQIKFDEVSALFTGVRVFSWVVALGTILAGVIGVGNIMLIVVKERTREIGLRKALGATSWNIISMIVQEALVLTMVAGYTGLVAGVFLLEVVSDWLAQAENSIFGKAELDFTTAFIAILVLMLAGVLASLLPASKAAHVSPIVALQDE